MWSENLKKLGVYKRRKSVFDYNKNENTSKQQEQDMKFIASLIACLTAKQVLAVGDWF